MPNRPGHGGHRVVEIGARRAVASVAIFWESGGNNFLLPPLEFGKLVAKLPIRGEDRRC